MTLHLVPRRPSEEGRLKSVLSDTLHTPHHWSYRLQIALLRNATHELWCAFLGDARQVRLRSSPNIALRPSSSARLSLNQVVPSRILLRRGRAVQHRRPALVARELDQEVLRGSMSPVHGYRTQASALGNLVYDTDVAHLYNGLRRVSARLVFQH